MSYLLAWEPDLYEAVVTLATAMVCLTFYGFTINSSYLHKRFIQKFGEEKGIIRWVFFSRYAGVFYFLLVPLSMIYALLPEDITLYGVGLVNVGKSLIWILALGSGIILFQSLFARNPVNLRHYPQIRIPVWTVSLIVKNSLLWFIYLLSYEFMFRGFLLFGTVGALGVWPAILVNTMIYSLSHLPRGARVTILAIPFGILICYLTLKTGTIWVALFLHLILAVSNDIFSIIANPEMKIKKDRLP